MTYPKICKTCGKHFQAVKKSRQFCSYSCSRNSRVIPKPHFTCLQCGKEFVLRRPEVIGADKFCSPECYRASIRVYKTCPQCGNRFTGHNDIYCSLKCTSESQRKRTLAHCAFCGNSFEIKPYQVAKGTGVYCSSRCAHAAQISQRANFICDHCGNSFDVWPSQLKYRTPRFCSLDCSRKHSGETIPERLVREALDNISILFEQEHHHLSYFLDFYIPSMKIDIEVDGDYWHRNKGAHDRTRDESLAGVGISTIRIKEREIVASSDITSLIRKKLSL